MVKVKIFVVVGGGVLSRGVGGVQCPQVTWSKCSLFSLLTCCAVETRLSCSTDVVLVLLDPQFDHVLRLLQDVHGVLHGAVLQTQVVDGQQPVSRFQSTGSTGHKERITDINPDLEVWTLTHRENPIRPGSKWNRLDGR